MKKTKRAYRLEAARCRRHAIGHVWRALCASRASGAYLAGDQDMQIPQLESLAGVCLANQALAAREQALKHQDEGAFKYAKKLLERTHVLTRASADYYGYYTYQLAETYFQWATMLEKKWSTAPLTPTRRQKASKENKYQEAVKEFRHAIRINPDKIDFRISLAQAYLCIGKDQNALDEFEKVLSNISQTTRAARDKMLDVYADAQNHRNADTTMRTRIRVMGDFLSVESQVKALEENLRQGEISSKEFKKQLEAQLVDYHKTDNAWGIAIVTLAMGKLGPEMFSHGSMQQRYQIAIRALSHEKILQRKEGFEWEKGQINRVLGSLYLESEEKDAPHRAETCFRKAREELEKKHFQEIRLQKLPLLLARSLLMQEDQVKWAQALQVLTLAVSHALDYDEREVLGDAYFKLDEFDKAIEAWKDALSWRNAMLKEPDSADIKYKIGNANVEKARHCFEMERWNEALEEAIVYLRQALDLYRSDQQQKKSGYTCYLLGIIHLELGKYWEAISFLKMSKALAYPYCTSIFYLGYALLKNKEYRESIKQFKALTIEVQNARDQLRKSGTSNDVAIEARPIEAEPKEILSVEPITLGEFEALGYWGQAFAIVESDGNFKLAQDLINLAVSIIDDHYKERTELLRFPSKYPDCLGWVHYKLDTNITGAIEHLELALANAENAEIYLHLALAYERQYQLLSNEIYLQRAQIYSQHALDIDIRAEYKKQVENLQQRLMSIGQEVSAQKEMQVQAKSNGAASH